MKDVQCYELFGGIALKNHAFSLSVAMMFLVWIFCAGARQVDFLGLFTYLMATSMSFSLVTQVL